MVLLIFPTSLWLYFYTVSTQQSLNLETYFMWHINWLLATFRFVGKFWNLQQVSEPMLNMYPSEQVSINLISNLYVIFLFLKYFKLFYKACM